MKKVLRTLILILLFMFIPTVKAEEFNYVDNVYDIVGESATTNVGIYLFYSSSCPHCKKENEFLNEIENTYGDKITIRRYEVSSNTINDSYMEQAKEKMNCTSGGVPFTVIGDKYYLGYTETTGNNIKYTIDEYIKSMKNVNIVPEDNDEDNDIIDNEVDDSNQMDLPLLGTVDIKKVSIPLVTIILGTLDGFNPCAMWVLLFLINMLFTMKDRKKMWILGLTFLFTSAFVYFLAMLGLSVVLSYTTVIWVRVLIAIVAIIGGIVNLNSYVKTPKDGCNIVDDKKRKKYFTKIKKFTSEQNMFLALLGVIALAASVNMVELACSAGFPTIFVSILDLNGITGIQNILYILLYIFFFLIDDIIVFIIAMVTLKISGITTKYNKYSHLVGGIIMILIGLLLILKPEWIMLNF